MPRSVQGMGEMKGRAAAYAAAFAAAVMIAQQVAGKAARDALFLSHYAANELPKAMASAAGLSLLGVLVTSSAMQRFGPARVVPIAFAASAMFFGAEWFIVETNPGLGAWVIYLHMAVFGAIVISGFWSVVNERFDPHSAKKAVARITAAATFGGLVGGLSAERIAVLLEPRAMLLILAAMNLVCAIAVQRIGQPVRGERPSVAPQGVGPAAGFQILRTMPYLQKLAALVLLVAMTAALLDFALKAQAADRLESGQTLMQFFALFYTATGLLSFVVQSLLARRLLDKLGIEGTIALLPALVLLTGVLATAVTRMWTVALVRGAESVLANSFFRSGYELLYTPIAARRKRATKTIIDVGFDRMGDATGSAVIFLVLWLAPEDTVVTAVIGVAVGVAALAFLVARTLHHGYVGALAESLRTGAVRLQDADVVDATTRRTLSETTLALDRERLLAEVAALRQRGGRLGEDDTRHDEPKQETSDQTRAEAEPSVAREVERLASGDTTRVRRALGARPFDPRLAPFAVKLLGNDELYRDARDALLDVRDRVSGALADALLDTEQPAVVRRRIPRMLGESSSPIAVAALVSGLRDERFDVRYQCGQALARICVRNPELAPPHDHVLEIVALELDADQEVIDSRGGDLEEAENEGAFIDDVLRSRMERSLEHIFTVLSVTLDREPLLLSLRALHSDDEALRGTALEYLENVLSPGLHERLVPHLSARARPARTERRTREQIVDDMLRSLDGLRPDPSRGSS